MRQIAVTLYPLPNLLFVNIPKPNRPSSGPYVYPARSRIIPIIDLLSIHLKIMMHSRKIIAKLRCTKILVFFCAASERPSFLLMPRMSMQNVEVSAVSAPSALGNNAEMSAMMNMIPIAGGR